jgi:hypothetical protein
MKVKVSNMQLCRKIINIGGVFFCLEFFCFNVLLPPSSGIAGDFSLKCGIKSENARYVH